jgi:hypothetical protein
MFLFNSLTLYNSCEAKIFISENYRPVLRSRTQAL